MVMEDIPDFLRRTADSNSYSTPRAYRRRSPKLKMPNRRTHERPLPKTMTPEAWALLHEIEAAAARKTKARLAALKERRAAR